MRDSAVTYNGKVRLGKGIAKSLLKVHDFLSACGNNSEPSRVAVELLDIRSEGQDWFESLKTRFESKHELYGWNPLGDDTLHQWVVLTDGASSLEELAAQLDLYSPLPKHELQPLVLNIRFDFCLTYESKEELPFQTPSDYGDFVSPDRKAEKLGTCRIDAYLSENSTMNLFLTLPYETGTCELAEYVEFLRESAKFKIGRTNWKAWRKTKRNTYQKSKIVL